MQKGARQSGIDKEIHDLRKCAKNEGVSKGPKDTTSFQNKWKYREDKKHICEETFIYFIFDWKSCNKVYSYLDQWHGNNGLLDYTVAQKKP